MSGKKFIIGTRGSDLALWQAHHVKDKLQKAGFESELLIIKTKGDEIQHLSLDKIEGKGFFTKEIEEALLSETIDIAVHSHKDLETQQPTGLSIAAVSLRADAREMLIIRKESFDSTQQLSFKSGAIIGTSSSRRKAQILQLRPDITLEDIRGNVPTRVDKLRSGKYDAILLAKAGLDRLNLNLSDVIAIPIDTSLLVPAPAQGALAIQCRSNDLDAIKASSVMNDHLTQQCIQIERGVLAALKGGCHLPLGVYATFEEGEFTVEVSYASAWDQPNRKMTFITDNPVDIVETIIREITSA